MVSLRNGSVGTVVTGSQTLLSAVSLTSVANATAALDTIDAALDKVNSERAALGAVQNRFESTITNLQLAENSLPDRVFRMLILLRRLLH